MKRAFNRRRLGLALVLALTGLAALAALAYGVVGVYSNSFSAERDSQVLKRSEGQHCDREIKKGSLRVTVKRGKEVCGYYLPVEGDAPQPDLDIKSRMKIQKPESKHLRKNAFFSVAVRSGPDTRYQLRVFPKGRKFLLKRSPPEHGFNVSGKNNAINSINDFSKIELQAFGRTVKAFANGKKLAEARDSTPEDIKGRRAEIVAGNLHKTDKDVSARIDSVHISVPNP